MSSSPSDARFTSGTPAASGLLVRLLLLFCHEPPEHTMIHPKEPLGPLFEIFPMLPAEIQGKRVIDFGCGEGYQVVALAEAGAAQVTGVEYNPVAAEGAQERIRTHGVAGKASIIEKLNGETADIIISQNSFEHFTQPEAILESLKRALAPGGTVYITFGPLWYSPLGSHMNFFCRIPWVNLLFPERTVFEARTHFRGDGPRTYIEAGVAKMSLGKFERLVSHCGLEMEWKRYDCLKRISGLQSVPVLRELFVNRVSCILTPKQITPRTQAAAS